MIGSVLNIQNTFFETVRMNKTREIHPFTFLIGASWSETRLK